MRRTRLAGALATITVAATTLIATAAGTAAAADGPNLAAGRAATASTANGPYVAANLTDGNQGSYWESSGAFPQWAQVDLGPVTSVDRVVLKLPGTWEARTQTLSVQGSTDGSSFATIATGAGRSFTPGAGNTVTVDVPVTAARYVRVQITANTGWAAAQLAEIEVYGPGGGGGGANLAVGRPITASSTIFTFVATNANDNNLATYWEAAAGTFPNLLTVELGANAAVTSVVVKLNPDPVWGRRTQNIEVLGRGQGASAFTSLRGPADYTFDPATGNSVTIPVSAAVADVRLRINGNSGSSGGQVAEFQVIGAPAPNPTSPSPRCRRRRPRRSRPTPSRSPPPSAMEGRQRRARRTSTSTWARRWPARQRSARSRRVRPRR